MCSENKARDMLQKTWKRHEKHEDILNNTRKHMNVTSIIIWTSHKKKCSEKRSVSSQNVGKYVTIIIWTKSHKKMFRKKERVKSKSDKSSDNYRIYNKPVDLFLKDWTEYRTKKNIVFSVKKRKKSEQFPELSGILNAFIIYH